MVKCKLHQPILLQTLDGGLLTVSLGAWMQLPNLSMENWEANHLATKQVSRTLLQLPILSGNFSGPEPPTFPPPHPIGNYFSVC